MWSLRQVPDHNISVFYCKREHIIPPLPRRCRLARRAAAATPVPPPPLPHHHCAAAASTAVLPLLPSCHCCHRHCRRRHCASASAAPKLPSPPPLPSFESSSSSLPLPLPPLSSPHPLLSLGVSPPGVGYHRCRIHRCYRCYRCCRHRCLHHLPC